MTFHCVYRNIYVVVVPLKRARGVIRHLKSPDEMDLEEVGLTAFKDLSTWNYFAYSICSLVTPP